MKEELTTLPEKLTTRDEISEFLEDLASRNSEKYNLTKCCEELNELSTVLLQFANKKGECLPDIQEVYDEMGDVILRLEMAIVSMGLDEEMIEKRIYTKANKWLSYVTDNKYSEI